MANDEGNKIVLLGESGVGKTCILNRFLNGKHDENCVANITAQFCKKNVMLPGGKSIEFEIWDTAGQERYRSLTKVFYNNASACILVYDITKKETFDDIINYWVPEIKENAPKDIILALAGNKSDKYENTEVSEEEGKSLAKEIKSIYMRTSAKLNSSIDELFNAIGNKFLNPNMEITSNLTKEEMILKNEQMRRDKIRINKINNKNKKKCC